MTNVVVDTDVVSYVFLKIIPSVPATIQSLPAASR
jgi:hypothetical protein